MALLANYVRKSYIRHYLLSAIAFSGTYLLIDFIEKIDNFIGKSAPVSMIVLYFTSSLPLILIRVTPIAILMAAFMTMGNLSKTGEITAMRAGGLSLIKISRPLVMVTIIITVGIVLIQELAVPVSTRTMREIWNVKIKGESAPQIVRDKIWYRSGNQMIYIGQAQTASGLLRDITIFDLNERFNIEKRIDADRAKYQDEDWVFYDTVERIFSPESGELTGRIVSKKTNIPLNKTPANFKHVEATPGELTFIDLYHEIDRLQAEGYNTVRHRVDMQTHIAAPFACIVMVLLGIPFALHRGRSASLASGIVISILVGVSYFIVNSVATVFGYSGILSPLIATWASNIIFVLIGTWFILFRTE
jgi:lipopolysaccharide export system permease protein